MLSNIMQEVLQMLEDETQSQPSTLEYELAYQARVAIDRIRFAIKHTDQFCPRSNALHEAELQLLDALQRLETVERPFQQRSRLRRAPQSHIAQDANGRGKEVSS